MARRSAVSQSFASILWAFVATVAATAGAVEPSRLSQDDLEQPDAVVAWLKANHSSKASLSASQGFYDYALKAKQRNDWGAAAKGFGESAIHYPTPKALNGYADSLLHMLGQIRQREKSYRERKKGDLEGVEATYRSALAADTVLKQMTDEERKRTQQNAECLAEYLKTSAPPASCPPLVAYGVQQAGKGEVPGR